MLDSGKPLLSKGGPWIVPVLLTMILSAPTAVPGCGKKKSSPRESPRTISECTRAIELNPTDARAYNNRGAVYAKLGRFDKAAADFTKAIELDPKDAKAYKNRGLIYLGSGQFSKAVFDFNKVISLNPEYAGGYYNRGNAYARLGEFEQARKDLLTAVRLDPAFRWRVERVSDQFKLGLKPDDAH